MLSRLLCRLGFHQRHYTLHFMERWVWRCSRCPAMEVDLG